MGWVLWVAAIGINATPFALVAVRRADRARLAKWKRRCFASSVAVFALCVGVFAIAALLTNPASDPNSAADRARFLANVISEGINSFAFAVVTSALPLVAAFVLRRRERSAASTA